MQSLTRLTDALAKVRSQLGEIDLGAYRQAMDDVRVMFDEAVDFDELDDPCIERVAAPTAASVAKYQEALAGWERCANDGSCSTTSPSSAVTDLFVDASDKLEEALTGLRAGGA